MFSKIQSLFAFPGFEWTWPAFTSDEWRAAAILGALGLFFAIEVKFGRRNDAKKIVRHSYLTNTGVFVLNDTLMSLLSISSLCLIANRYAEWGLLSSIADPAWKMLLSFILLDFALYLWHRACHTVDSLWMFHKVHHSDRCMNVSTVFRLHFGELVLSTLVKAVFIVTMGVDTTIVLLNETIITLFVLFHHANVAFPGERWFSRLIIVPSLHRVHHSVRREEHDLNYGAVFSLWDKLFGTFGEMVPKKLGLNLVKEQNVFDLLTFGLTPAYTPNDQTVQAMIAEAAYYRAEKRGFAPGCDFRDWLAAERDIYNG